MKFFLIISVTMTMFFAYMLSGGRGGCGGCGGSGGCGLVYGQSFEDPSQHFKKMTFESTLRGSFNLSECVKELINCFELVRPEVICEHNKVMDDTVCGVMRQICHDYYGNYDSYSHRFQMYAQYCRDEHSQNWT